jgi:hypothetical protein
MAFSDPPDLNKLAEQLQQAGAHLKAHADKADVQQNNIFFESLDHMNNRLENIETTLNDIQTRVAYIDGQAQVRHRKDVHEAA